jgi:hypothetical protein
MAKYTPDAPLPPVDVAEGTWFLGAAVAYSHIGFALVPNQPGTKAVAKDVLRQRPEGDRSEWWSYVALTNPADVERIWTAYPAYCPGLVTGRISRVLVLDLDVKNGENPHQELQDWQDSTGIKLPEGPKVLTPTGGEHWYYSLPADCPPIESVSGWLPGVDIRADKGQLILPPSFNKAVEDKQEAEHGYVIDSQYHWMDLGGAPYSPTPEEIRSELDDASVPEGLARDILNHGSRRTIGARQKRAGGAETIDKDGVVRSKDGFIDVDYYEANGIPAGLQENVLQLLATKMGGYMAIPVEDAVNRCWAIIQKSEQRGSDPWTQYEVSRKVRRQHQWAMSDTQFKRAEKAAEMDEAVAYLNNFLSKKGK